MPFHFEDVNNDNNEDVNNNIDDNDNHDSDDELRWLSWAAYKLVTT